MQRENNSHSTPQRHEPAWNKGRVVGAKPPLKPKQVWSVRFHLQREARIRDLALFDLAIDSKLRGCDLVRLRIGDIVSGREVRQRAIVVQQKTGRPVQFEITETARDSVLAWLKRRGGSVDDFLFPSRVDRYGHITTRRYARLVDEWFGSGWSQPCELRHPLTAANQGVGDLQAHRQPASHADPAWAHQAREHGQVLGRRHRGRADARRSN